MEDQGSSRQFELAVRLERRRDHRYLSYEKVFPVSVRDVAGRDQQELIRFAGEQERVNEIRVFGYYYPRAADRQFVDIRVGGAITGGQVERVEYIMARVA